MRSEGYQSMVRWIERGIREGGYTTLASDTPASEAPGDHPVTETGVGYVVSWNGIQNIRNFTLD